MLPEAPREGYDLFVSFALADNRGEELEKVSALVRAIQVEYERVIGTPLRVFFNTHPIQSMDEWESTIKIGLLQSRLMVAVLSPAYFTSAFCRRRMGASRRNRAGEGTAGGGDHTDIR